MSLGVAFFGFMFLFFLVICVYFVWREFFLSIWHKKTNQAQSVEKSPEWHAFLDRRKEIDNDPTLDEHSKNTLIENWKVMALESRPHMQTRQVQSSMSLAWIRPGVLPWLVAVCLALATLLTYSVGAMHTGALTWPIAGVQASLENTPAVDQKVVSGAAHPGDGAKLKDRLAGLKARLAEQPDDLQGWILLSRTHASMSNFTESAAALKKALALNPDHPDILADLADVTAMTQGRVLAGVPEQYIAAALRGDPQHEKALALAASAAEQAGKKDQASMYWQLLSQVQQSKLKNATSSVAENKTGPVLTTVAVDVPHAALNSIQQKSVLFVFMKAQSGPGMPLAVVRVSASQIRAGRQLVPFSADNFIQPEAFENLPETLYFQARLSIQGVAQPGNGDVASEWVSLPRSQLAQGTAVALGADSKN